MVGCSSGIPKPKHHPLDVDRTILPGVIRRQQGLAATTWFHFWLSAGTGEWMARMLQAAGDALTVSTCFGPTPTRHPASLTKCPTRYGSGSAGGVDFIRSGVPQAVRKQAAIRHEQLLRARLGQRSVEVLGGTILSTFTSGSKLRAECWPQASWGARTNLAPMSTNSSNGARDALERAKGRSTWQGQSTHPPRPQAGLDEKALALVGLLCPLDYRRTRLGTPVCACPLLDVQSHWKTQTCRCASPPMSEGFPRRARRRSLNEGQ